MLDFDTRVFSVPTSPYDLRSSLTRNNLCPRLISSRALRSSLLIILGVGIAAFTSWATLTGYTAKLANAKSPSSGPSAATKPARPNLNKTYGNLPLSFEANSGQTDTNVKYVARGPGYNIFLTPAEAVLVFRPADKNSKEAAAKLEDPDEVSGVGPASHRQLERLRERAAGQNAVDANPTVVRMRLDGANANPRAVEGVDELPGKVNYFNGANPKNWRTGIKTYARVRYQKIYPGVDLIYYGNQRQLEYDFVVAPGANANAIKLSFEGTQGISINERGDLVLKAERGDIFQHKPAIYQEVRGVRKAVAGAYVLKGKKAVGFQLGEYDRTKPLIIDPVLSYSTYLGGDSDLGYGIAVDSSGSAYITGETSSTFFPTKPGAYDTTFNGSIDAFVSKLDPTGSQLIYSTYIGGSGADWAYDIAIDSSGSAYIAGFASSGFPVTPGAFQTSFGGGASDGFVAKLSAAGDSLVYSSYIGGTGDEVGNSIAVDSSGSAYVAGQTSSGANFPVTSGAFQTTGQGGNDAFVLKVNTTGSALLYSTFLGGADGESGRGIAIDSSGNAFVTGSTFSTNFPTLNPIQTASNDRGLFKSTNSGSNWSHLTSGLMTTGFSSLAIDPTNSSIIYAGAAGGVYKSTDGGNNWAKTSLFALIVRAMVIDPTNPSIIYAGTGGGVFKSTDAGGSWASMNSGLTAISGQQTIVPAILSLAINPITPSEIYAGTQNFRVYKTTNGGASWTAVNTGMPVSTNVNALAIPVSAAAIYAGTNRGVFQSVNSGSNWTAINTGLVIPNTTTVPNVTSLVIHPTNPLTIYAGTSNSFVFKSTNGGTNWTALNDLSAPRFANTLALDPTNSSIIYSGGSGGASKSTDGGATWLNITNELTVPIASGTFNLNINALVINPGNPSTLYVGTGGNNEAFVTKLNASGSGLIYSTYLSGNASDFGESIALDSSNNAYVTGTTVSDNFPTTPGAYRTSHTFLDNDVFVTKLNATGSQLVYSTYLGGSSIDNGFGIAVDSAGSAYAYGRTRSVDFPATPGSFQTTIGGRTGSAFDAFITKLNPAGSGLVYSSFLGGGDNDLLFSPAAITVDAAGNAYVVGSTVGLDFPVTADAYQSSKFGTLDAAFVAKISEAASSFSIIGRLTTGTNAPIAGAFVDASNATGTFRSTRTDSQGFYALVSLPAGDYTVTPNKFDSTGRHYLYTPTSRTFTGLNSDQTAADFTGTQVFDIKGQVTSSSVAGLGIFDVTVTLSGAASATATTDADGNYSFQDLLFGDYTVTPGKAGFTFNPVNRSFISLSADQFGAGFTTASGSFFTVSGRVADAGNAAISNVTIAVLSSPQHGLRILSTLTDANGNYSIPNLQAGGNYNFTPAKPILSFTPQSPTLNNLSANQTLNFTATQATGLVGKIAFVKDFVDIYVMNADGTNEQSILTGSTGSNQCSGDGGPQWSPDGARLAFSQCGTDFNADLYTMNADGTGLQRLTNAPFLDVFPSWSPDGTRLTFSYGDCSSNGFIPEIFAINAAGTIRSRLTNNLGFDAFSDWSPGGSTIVFASGAQGDCSGSDANIYVMDTDGGHQTKLTNGIPLGLAPAYSPDGFKIAYVREVFDPVRNVFSQNLYVMNADGTGQTKIGPDFSEAGNGGKPTWSPDGTRIMFSGSLLGFNGSNQFFVINADGTGLVQITTGTAFRESPAWQHYSISGHVTGNTNGVPVTMALAGTLTRVTETDVNGNYVFGNLAPGGNYSVSPVSTAFTFNPAKTDVSNLTGNQIANFAVVPLAVPAPTPPLADDFNAAQRDPAKWNLGTQTQPLGSFDPAVSVVQQSGRLVITPRTNTPDLHYNGYVSVDSFDFNNAKATVELAQTATGEAETVFAIGSDLDNFSRFVVRAGGGTTGFLKGGIKPLDTGVAQLILQVRVAGELTSLSIPYDPVLHRYMRFRHEPPTNSIVFETSPNNVDFTERHRVVLQKSVSALTTELSAGTSTPTTPGQAIFDNFQLVTNTFQFSATNFTVGEGDVSTQITVTRSGSAATAATVEYATYDETALQRTKYVPSLGTLAFAPGETAKVFTVLIEDNSLVEGTQTVSLRLADSFGAGLNSPGRAVLTINDNDSSPGATNPMDDPQFFVRQHYYDFLNRAPDSAGLSYWSGQITQCGTDQSCVRNKRVDVSNAFFYEAEFQQTGAYVYRLYRAAFGNSQPFANPYPDPLYPGEADKLPSYAVFVSDRARVVGGASLAQAQLDLANAFVQRPEFRATYPASLSGPDFIDALLLKVMTDIKDKNGVPVDLGSQRTALINLLNTSGRGAVMYRLVDDNLVTNPINNRAFIDAEYNRAFVYTQYGGYLRRDSDIGGFLFWLGQVNNGALRDGTKQHGMVCAFITSAELQQRFSLAVTHSNQECLP